MKSNEFINNTGNPKHTVSEGYWQDAVAKAQADREARAGKPYEKNPASHDKQGVYVGDKDLDGKPVPRRKPAVAEGGYDPSKPYGVRYKVFAGKEGRITTKEYWTTSAEKLEKAVAKIEAMDNFYEIDGYAGPDKVNEMFADRGAGHPEKETKADREYVKRLKNRNMPSKSKPGPTKNKEQQGVAEGVTSPEIKQAYADAMKTEPGTPERKRAVRLYQKLRADAIQKNKENSGVEEGYRVVPNIDHDMYAEQDQRPKTVVSTKHKPKKVQPSTAGQTAHPYQGKLVGEQQTEVNVNSDAYRAGFRDGSQYYPTPDPRASSKYGPGASDYNAGYTAGLAHEKQAKSDRVAAYHAKLAPYIKMTPAQLDAAEQDALDGRKEIQQAADKNKITPEMKVRYRELNDVLQDIHQARFQLQQGVQEGKLAKAAGAAAVVAAMMAGDKLTSAENTEIGQALAKAAQRGDTDAAEHLKKLDMYFDTKQSVTLTRLANKYLHGIEEGSKKKTHATIR
jgi:hypothetical protein